MWPSVQSDRELCKFQVVALKERSILSPFSFLFPKAWTADTGWAFLDHARRAKNQDWLSHRTEGIRIPGDFVEQNCHSSSDFDMRDKGIPCLSHCSLGLCPMQLHIYSYQFNIHISYVFNLFFCSRASGEVFPFTNSGFPPILKGMISTPISQCCRKN